METTTQKTPIETAAFELAMQILNRESVKAGRPILEGDDHAGTVTAWLDHIAAKIVTMTGMIELGEIPLAKRERFTVETLFDDYRPSQFTRDDTEQAIETMQQGRDELPLDADEQILYDELVRLDTKLSDAGYGTVAVQQGYEDDHLNDLLPSDLPEWLNERIDWESVYRSVIRDMDVVEIEGVPYTVMAVER